MTPKERVERIMVELLINQQAKGGVLFQFDRYALENLFLRACEVVAYVDARFSTEQTSTGEEGK